MQVLGVNILDFHCEHFSYCSCIYHSTGEDRLITREAQSRYSVELPNDRVVFGRGEVSSIRQNFTRHRVYR